MEAAEIQRHIDRRRAAEARKSDTAVELAKVVPTAVAIEKSHGPDAQKDREISKYRRLVNDPGTEDWLFGYAADLLLVHGQDAGRGDASAIFRRMNAVVKELEEIRDIQSRRGMEQRPRGAWFNIRVLAIARDHGIKLPGQLKAEREAKRYAEAAT